MFAKLKDWRALQLDMSEEPALSSPQSYLQPSLSGGFNEPGFQVIGKSGEQYKPF